MKNLTEQILDNMRIINTEDGKNEMLSIFERDFQNDENAMVFATLIALSDEVADAISRARSQFKIETLKDKF